MSFLSKARSIIIIIIGGKEAKPSFNFRIGQPQPKNRTSTMLEVSITNEQKVKVTLNPVTATGKPAKLDGAPTWTLTSGEATVVPADDGLSAELVSSDAPGEAIINVEADADLGSGVVNIAEAIKLTTLGAQATNLGLQVGTPEPK